MKSYINLLIQTVVTELHFFLFVENNIMYTLFIHFTNHLATGFSINLLLGVPTLVFVLKNAVYKLSTNTVSIISSLHRIGNSELTAVPTY